MSLLDPLPSSASATSAGAAQGGASASALQGSVRPPPGVVQVHWVDLETAVSPALELRLRDWLTEEERARHLRFRFTRDRDAFLIGRSLIRGTLARLLGCAPAEVPLVAGPHGRPELLPGLLPGAPSFNVSHTEGVVAYALARRVVGVDVERFRSDPEPLEIGRQVFSPRELAALATVDPQEQRLRFRRLWALKEAYIKARGMGMVLPLREVTCEVAEGGPACFHFGPAVRDDPARWRCVELRPTPSTWAAICVEAAPGEAVQVEQQWLPLPRE